MIRCLALMGAVLALLPLTATTARSQVDPLPSWRPGPTRDALLAFVERVSRSGSPDWVPAEERLAVFDNDGTLWPENPIPPRLPTRGSALACWCTTPMPAANTLTTPGPPAAANWWRR